MINGFKSVISLIDLMSNIRDNIDKYHDELFSEACNESVLRNCAPEAIRESFPAESPS